MSVGTVVALKANMQTDVGSAAYRIETPSDVIGMDSRDEAIERAKALSKQTGRTVALVRGDGRLRMEFVDGEMTVYRSAR